MTRCSQCQFENRQGVRFCEQCGAKFDPRCPACGAVVPADRRFCGECGQPLDTAGATSALNAAAPRSYTPAHLAEKILTSRSALEGERKLVTVLFCDIANSTALAERLGPEPMHTLLNGFFELALGEVHRYEGTINQFLGDGFMALFGAPIAHEDHARRAVLASLGIQRALQEREAHCADEGDRLVVRMGLNTGSVVVGKIGDNLRMDYTAVGDTTNLAARMQQAAEFGQICLTESTDRATQNHFESEYLGDRAVKGKTEAVPIYRLIGVRSRGDPVRTPLGAGISSPLVGRDAEVATFRASVDRLLAGRGGLVRVTGEAGLGKSRLMAEVRRQTATTPLRWLEGRCLSFGRTMSYWPFLEIIREGGA